MKLEKLALLALCLLAPLLVFLSSREEPSSLTSTLLPEQELLASAPGTSFRGAQLPRVQGPPGDADLNLGVAQTPQDGAAAGIAAPVPVERVDAAELGYMQGRVLLEGEPAPGVMVDLFCSIGTKLAMDVEMRRGWEHKFKDEPDSIPDLQEELTIDPQTLRYTQASSPTVRTGVDGHYRFDGLGPGVYLMVIRYPMDEARKARCQWNVHTAQRYYLCGTIPKRDFPDFHLGFEDSYLALLAMHWIDAKVRVQCGQAGLRVQVIEQTKGLDPSVGLTEKQAELSKTWRPELGWSQMPQETMETLLRKAEGVTNRSRQLVHANGSINKNSVGTTNEAGELLFDWDRPLPLRIELHGKEGRLMGTSGQFVTLNPSGETLVTIAAVPGSLRINLPGHFDLQANQAVQYRLERMPANGLYARVETIYGDRTQVSKQGLRAGPKHLEFLELRAGRYAVQASYMYQDTDSRWYPLGETSPTDVEVFAGKLAVCHLVTRPK